MYTKRTPKEVLEFAAREGVQLVDLKFTSLYFFPVLSVFFQIECWIG